MKLKKIAILFVLMIISLIGNVSCNQFLDVPPQGKLTLDQFWKNREQAVAAIAGIYSNAGSSSWNFSSSGSMSDLDISPVEAYIYWGEMRGDLLAFAPGILTASQQNKENIDNMLVNSSDVTTKYTDFYRIINESNQAIKYIPNIINIDPSLSSTEADQLVGEAYFLRAYAYFWLVRTFKEIPLVLVPSETDAQDYNVAKSTKDEILSQIIQDLILAKNTLPEWYSNSQYPRVRATCYTAATVLSDVYLWQAATNSTSEANNDLYDKAISNCDTVINSGRYILLPGSSLSTIFLAGNSGESIFETYANALLNTQTNRLNDWCASLFVVPTSTDLLFSATIDQDYRGYDPPSGNQSYSQSTRYLRKFSSTSRDAHWIFYRYPDVLLMKAEAIAHRYPDDIDQLQVASDLVNTVRSRAYGTSDYLKASASSTLEMDKILLDERGKEFLGEGKRWFDLVRFASRNNFEHKELLTERVIGSFSPVLQLVVTPRVLNPDSWYLPLNSDALKTNSKLVQNPYYQ